MLYKPITGIVILISKDFLLRKLFRTILDKYPDYTYCPISKAEEIGSIDNPKIIFIQESRIIEQKDIRRIRFKLGVPIILITNSLERANIKQLFDFGVDYILEEPVKIEFIDAILFKHLKRSPYKSRSIVKYHGMVLYTDSHFLYYKDCKIFLTTTESLLMKILLTYDDPISITKIQELLFQEENRDVSIGSLRVVLHRLRNKFRMCTNMEIIGNRYREGYYIKL
jgi:DNA-binding response OmpR family regulator